MGVWGAAKLRLALRKAKEKRLALQHLAVLTNIRELDSHAEEWGVSENERKELIEVRSENIPTLPASDWSVMRIYPRFMRLIGLS